MINIAVKQGAKAAVRKTLKLRKRRRSTAKAKSIKFVIRSRSNPKKLKSPLKTIYFTFTNISY